LFIDSPLAAEEIEDAAEDAGRFGEAAFDAGKEPPQHSKSPGVP
jgi:hypothetical protein